jgi:chromosome segregation ATPase
MKVLIQVNLIGQENEQLREEQRIRDLNHEEEVAVLKNQILDAQRHTATENIQLIQLHKENNHKTGQISTLRAQLEGLEEQARQLRVEGESAQRDAKDLAGQLQEEQKRAIGLSQELTKNTSSKQVRLKPGKSSKVPRV